MTEHALQWCQGEIAQAFATLVVGVLLAAGAAAFATFGASPTARALVFPLLGLSLLMISGASYGIWDNKQRITRFQGAIDADRHAFVQAEIERVDGFDRIFRVTFPLFGALVGGGLALFFLAGGPNAKAIGLVMVLLGLAGLTFDHFARERAELYQQRLQSFPAVNQADSNPALLRRSRYFALQRVVPRIQHAIEGFTKSLRQEVGQFGIGVSTIRPGAVKSEVFDSVFAEHEDSEKWGEDYQQTVNKAI